MSGSWARWNRSVGRPYTIGVEEEVMLLDASDNSLAQRSDAVLARLSSELADHAFPETHAAVLELATGVHSDVAGAVAELAALREGLARDLRQLGVDAACAGMYPLAAPQATRISGTARYRLIADSMRCLAVREPTMALHVHVGIPDPEEAIRVLDGLRQSLPLLLALSANSPFFQGLDSGFASARTVIFGGFPRTGPPRAFGCYAEYVDALDALIASGALPDASFIWWDIRLQPGLGTVEVRVMDAQSSVAESAPLVALVQSLARSELEGPPRENRVAAEVLAENRFRAARDGLEARLIDPAHRKLVSVRTLVADLVEPCRPHAAVLGCSEELEQVRRLAAVNGAARQRAWIQGGGDLGRLVSRLVQQFTAQQRPVSHSIPATERSG